MKPFLILLLVCVIAPAWSNDELTPAFSALNSRDFDGAISVIQAIDPQDPEVLFHLARAQYLAGRMEASLETLEKLVHIKPDYADAYYLKGLTHLARLGEVGIFRLMGEAKRALKSWEQAVDIDPDHLDARYGIIAFYASAPGFAGGDLKMARSLTSALSERDKAYGMLAEGLILGREDRLAEAESQMQEAAVLMDRAGPHFGLAQFYMRHEEYEKALREIDIFDQKEKRWWDADITFSHFLKARAYSELGDDVQARHYVDMAMSLNPNGRVRDMLQGVLKDL